MVRRTNNLWLTKDVAEYYGVSTMTVSNWVRKHGMPCYILGPKKIQYDPALVKEWMDERAARLLSEKVVK